MQGPEQPRSHGGRSVVQLFVWSLSRGDELAGGYELRVLVALRAAATTWLGQSVHQRNLGCQEASGILKDAFEIVIIIVY